MRLADAQTIEDARISGIAAKAWRSVVAFVPMRVAE